MSCYIHFVIHMQEKYKSTYSSTDCTVSDCRLHHRVRLKFQSHHPDSCAMIYFPVRKSPDKPPISPSLYIFTCFHAPASLSRCKLELTELLFKFSPLPLYKWAVKVLNGASFIVAPYLISKYSILKFGTLVGKPFRLCFPRRRAGSR